MSLLIAVPSPLDTRSLYYQRVSGDTPSVILGKYIFLIPGCVKFKCMTDLVDQSIHHLHVYDLEGSYSNLAGIENPKSWNFSLCEETQIPNALASKIDSIALKELAFKNKFPPTEPSDEWMNSLESMFRSELTVEQIVDHVHSSIAEAKMNGTDIESEMKERAELSRLKKEVGAEFFEFAKSKGIHL